jgi:hypothetical protein
LKRKSFSLHFCKYIVYKMKEMFTKQIYELYFAIFGQHWSNFGQVKKGLSFQPNFFPCFSSLRTQAWGSIFAYLTTLGRTKNFLLKGCTLLTPLYFEILFQSLFKHGEHFISENLLFNFLLSLSVLKQGALIILRAERLCAHFYTQSEIKLQLDRKEKT